MDSVNEHIEDYLDGLMSSEQKASFERQMAADDQLRKQVELQRTLRDTISRRLSVEAFEVQRTISLAAKQHRGQSKGKVVKWSILAGIAAAIALFVLFFPFKGEELYEIPEMQSHIVRGEESSELYENARELYEKGKFAEARGVIEKLILKEPDNVEYSFYHALTFYGAEQWKEAERALAPISEGPSVFSDQAKYYLAICSYKLNEKEEAVSILKSISSQSDMYKQSQQLLKKWQ